MTAWSATWAGETHSRTGVLEVTDEKRKATVRLNLLSAPAPAAELGVSATPVREAMLDLTREGLVGAVRTKGFRITGMTERDLDGFTEIRSLVEVPAVVRGTTMATAEQAEALRLGAQQSASRGRPAPRGAGASTADCPADSPSTPPPRRRCAATRWTSGGRRRR